MARVISWVVVGPEPWLATCLRCGEHQAKFVLPKPIDGVVAYMRGFIKLHEKCPEPIGVAT